MALIDHRACLSRFLRRRIGAGINHDKSFDKFGGVLLVLNGAHQIADDLFLVVRRNKKGIFVLLFGRRKLDIALDEYPNQKQKLIEVRKGIKTKHQSVEKDYWCNGGMIKLVHEIIPSSLVVWRVWRRWR